MVVVTAVPVPVLARCRSRVARRSFCHAEPPAELPFKGCLDSVRAFESRYRGRQAQPHVRAAIHDQLLIAVAAKRLDIRPFRREPRAQKLRPKSYQLLTDHRSRFQEISHREQYRKPA